MDKVLEVTGLGWSGECSVGPCRTLEVGLVGKQGGRVLPPFVWRIVYFSGFLHG